MARSRRKNATPGSSEPPPEPDAPDTPEEAALPTPLPDPEPQPRAAAPASPLAPGPAFGEPGPNERVYAVVFGRVWLAALGAVSAMRRWTTTATDPVRGEILVEVGAMFGKTTRPVRITIALDHLGLTRVLAEGVEPNRIARFYRQVETLLRRDSRA